MFYQQQQQKKTHGVSLNCGTILPDDILGEKKIQNIQGEEK
jgi:hypothetical protein